MMTRLLPFLCFLLAAAPLFSHPAWGLVMDDAGNLYFSDLLHDRGAVYQYRTDGQLVKLLPQTHSHDLFIDSEGLLWGTDSRYFSQTDEWEVALWNWSPDQGQL